MKNILALNVILILLYACKNEVNKTIEEAKPTYLVLKKDSKEKYAYYDLKNKKILGDYEMAFTDTLFEFGIVWDKEFMLINKSGKKIYSIFPFDNGPDYESEGLYRIIDNNGKIGYATYLSDKIDIQPKFTCAYPFINGKAKVSVNCNKIQEGEHVSWESNEWIYINKKGEIIN
jgi:hypothetical protein